MSAHPRTARSPDAAEDLHMRIRSYLFIIALLGAAACARQDEKQTLTMASTAEQMSKLAATPEQAELWKAAGARSDRLDQVPVVTQPVQQRARVEAPNRAAQAQVTTQQTAEAPTTARILDAPDMREDAYRGPARIVNVQGDRVEFDLGQNRRLSAVLRIKAASLKATTGDTVQIEFRRRDDPHNRAELLAVKAAGGQNMVSVLEGDTKPVQLRVPLFQLTARQVGEAARGTMPVEVSVGRERKTLAQGETADFASAGMTVGIVASQAVTGEDVSREEGNPYAIRLLAWPTE
jgi:hypothetical protein